jgi:hypothetical protein
MKVKKVVVRFGQRAGELPVPVLYLYQVSRVAPMGAVSETYLTSTGYTIHFIK